MDINGKIAIVTGGGSGLGRASCELLASRGAMVVVVDFDGEKAREVAESIDGLPIQCDVSAPESVNRVFEQVDKELGTARILLNCAGISEAKLTVNRKGIPAPLENHQRIFAVHVQGTYDMLRQAAAAMFHAEPLNDDGERGVIINTSSIAAFEGQVGAVNYAAAKAAIAGMTLPLARELSAYGIRVNAIAPGLFMTGFADFLSQELLDELVSTSPFPKRYGRPEEFARLVAEICENVMFNGETVRLDAAYRMKF